MMTPIFIDMKFMMNLKLLMIPLIIFTGVLLSIAFFTLMERKIMGYMHYRKGPNKVLMAGLFQPIADALKLLTKENMKMMNSNYSMFILSPFLSFILMMSYWMFFESMSNLLSNNFKMMSIMVIMSLSSFSFLIMCWGSNSKYAIMGGYRAISQMISYEVCLILIFLFFVFFLKSFNLEKFIFLQKNLWFFSLLPIFILWVTMILAESNRTPFDLSEGESEIVSGFNIEYQSMTFTLIFIVEYGMLLFMSYITSFFFLGTNLILIKTMIMCFLFSWIRCSFPRMRYDKLMFFSWKVTLPYLLSILMVIMWF